MTDYYYAKEREESAVLRINDSYLEALNSLEKLEAENAKMRKLLEGIARGTYREMCTYRDESGCKGCSMRDGDKTCLIADASQLLGIEVA